MTEENFAEAPVSLAEKRSERAGRADYWKPRDALIHMLRMVDSGEVKPVDLIVCYCEDGEPGVSYSRFINASRDAQTCVGMMEIVKFKMLSFEE